MKKHSILYSTLSKLKNGLWKPDLYPTSLLLKKVFDNNPQGIIIKIGANDGILDDPTYPYLVDNYWKCIFVEPQKYFFEKLTSNLCGKGNFYFENIAIGDSTGTFTLYTIDVTSYPLLPSYCALCSSLDKDYVMSILKDFKLGEEAIIEEKTPVLLLKDLYAKYTLSNIDILQLDTEGYDAKIIRTIDFEHIVPRIIIFEHVNTPVVEYRQLCQSLRKRGYKLYYWDRDTIAVDFKSNKLLKRPLI